MLSSVLIAVGVILMLVAGGMWGWAQWQYHQVTANNEKLATYATVSDDPAAPEGPQVDWAGLKAVNDDVVGWVQVPGTNINFPVYQGDTNETYLRRAATGEYSVGGQVFMDYENARPGMVDRQTLIYGHHLGNGEMFTQVDDMASQETFDSVSTVWYATETQTYELEPLFFYKTPATNGDARRMTFASDDDFHAYLGNLLSQATTKSSKADEAVGRVSRILTLATCDYDNPFGHGNGRGLLVCALKSEVDPSSATTAPAATATTKETDGQEGSAQQTTAA